ncbi:MAG: hypothetical protein IPP34_15015 [Bacteroidetes bacterium]|nr:hypothetical protein [Bacteroidota bacterium]
MKLFQAGFLFIVFSIIACGTANAQKRNAIWCFGDSAAIDFSSGIASPISSGMDGRGSCASIADEGGNPYFLCSNNACIFNFGLSQPLYLIKIII